MYLLVAISGYFACAQKRRQSKKMGNEERIKSTMPTKVTRGEARAGGTHERTNASKNAVKSSIKRNEIKAERRERDTTEEEKSRWKRKLEKRVRRKGG